jgi:hypothetical protein
MIAKTKDPIAAAGKFEQAGVAAEGQMAFYLERAFGDSPNVTVFNDLRLVDGDAVAQIDHLVVHRFGMFIVESKSICGEVIVNQHGEWIRKWGAQRSGMQSPIQQARLQSDVLRKLLDSHKENLRDKVLMGYKQGSFRCCPIEIYVAISDRGIITRQGADPRELMKADLVCDRIRQEIERHRKASKLLSPIDGDYGVWRMNAQEMERVREFLVESHSPLKTASVGVPAKAVPPTLTPKPAPVNEVTPVAEKLACKHCGSNDLVGTYGKFGYYLKCRPCSKNTAIDYSCKGCGKKGRIRKQGPRFDRVCEACGREELVWLNTQT